MSLKKEITLQRRNQVEVAVKKLLGCNLNDLELKNGGNCLNFCLNEKNGEVILSDNRKIEWSWVYSQNKNIAKMRGAKISKEMIEKPDKVDYDNLEKFESVLVEGDSFNLTVFI